MWIENIISTKNVFFVSTDKKIETKIYFTSTYSFFDFFNSEKRYYAIKCPLKNRVTRQKGKITILIVWIISISLASVQLFVARVEDSVIKSSVFDNITNMTTTKLNTQKVCIEIWNESDRKTYTIFNLFAVYLIPVIILGKWTNIFCLMPVVILNRVWIKTGYTYTCIGCIIKQSTHPGNSDATRDNNYNKSKSKVVKTLIILVCVFALCWWADYIYQIIVDREFKKKIEISGCHCTYLIY